MSEIPWKIRNVMILDLRHLCCFKPRQRSWQPFETISRDIWSISYTESLHVGALLQVLDAQIRKGLKMRCGEEHHGRWQAAKDFIIQKRGIKQLKMP